ncbi:MAG: MaoC family dehydratase [Alphaproteobacteria bacterium]
MKHLEDIVVGSIENFGHYQVSEVEIISFAMRYDNQPFHTDAEAARDSIYGGLIASGWHVCAMFMRMACDAGVDECQPHGMGAPGFDDLKWLQPVRPGDVLSARTEVLSADPSRLKPYLGVVRSKIQISKQSGAAVMEMTAINRVLRRPVPTTD